jgi:hypothetical protein
MVEKGDSASVARGSAWRLYGARKVWGSSTARASFDALEWRSGHAQATAETVSTVLFIITRGSPRPCPAVAQGAPTVSSIPESFNARRASRSAVSTTVTMLPCCRWQSYRRRGWTRVCRARWGQGRRDRRVRRGHRLDERRSWWHGPRRARCSGWAGPRRSRTAAKDHADALRHPHHQSRAVGSASVPAASIPFTVR